MYRFLRIMRIVDLSFSLDDYPFASWASIGRVYVLGRLDRSGPV